MHEFSVDPKLTQSVGGEHAPFGAPGRALLAASR